MLGLGNSIITGGVSDWLVTDLSDLAHWFKYNTNLTLGTGDEVDTWDSNSSSETFTVGTGKVFKNSGDLDFTTGTSGGRMDLDATWDPGTFSVYIVMRIIAASVSNEEIMQSDSSNFIRFNNSTTARIRIGDTTNNDITLPGSELTQNTWFVFGIEWDASTIRLYQDTDYSTPTTASDSDTFAGLAKIGLRGNPFDGQIREVVLINDVLSSSDRENLMKHLISVRDI